jgi:hypothetical protein
LALHTLIDGVALAASVAAGEHAGGERLAGLATFIAILLHKPLDALSISAVMASAGWSRSSIQTVNAAFALMCPLGAAAFYLGAGELDEHQHILIGCSLGFAAGAFLCISLADILPEVQFHAHDQGKLSAALVLGVALAYAVGLVEAEQAHSLQRRNSRSSETLLDQTQPAGRRHPGHKAGHFVQHGRAGLIRAVAKETPTIARHAIAIAVGDEPGPGHQGKRHRSRHKQMWAKAATNRQPSVGLARRGQGRHKTAARRPTAAAAPTDTAACQPR